MVSIDIESGCHLIAKLSANQNAKHILLFTGKS
jgi:hypothetical protein